MKTFFTPHFTWRLPIIILLVLFSLSGFSQLGTYQFSGVLGSCPNTNNNVTTQPANAVFSPFTTVGTSCIASSYDFYTSNWNTGNSINLAEYNQFTITPNTKYSLILTSLSFTQQTDNDNSTTWILRSSLDNYTSNIAVGSVLSSPQTPVINFPASSFTNIGAVTFRLYIVASDKNAAPWSNDNVTLNGSVVLLPADPGNPTSNSPQCSNTGVTLTMSGAPPTGITWYWQTTPSGKSTANSASTFNVGASGIYYVRAQDNTTLAWSAGAGSLAIVITPDVGTPVFTLGSSSSRCQGASTATYQASATDNTNITYSLDASSLSAGNTIDASTGAVTYVSGWTNTSTITATATGCGSPKSSTHIVTTNLPLAAPVFSLGTSSVRCQGLSSQTITYTATAANSTSVTYALDATSNAFSGNSINSVTGAVTFSANWTGTSIVTASATGCYGPLVSTHTITTTPTVGIPVFSSGSSSSICQAAATINYAATSTNNTSITYSLDNTSLASGNTINSATGDVTYTSAWYGTSVITATATGCNGPKSSNHTVTINAPVTLPVFTFGSSSLRCQSAGNVTYTASSNNTIGITYSLDAASISGGNTINSATGKVTYTSVWTGTSTVTASAAGCYGPQNSSHTVTTELPVAAPVFATGLSPVRCQGSGVVNYSATSTNTTGITYALNAPSISGGNTIDVNTGDVTYVSTYSGTTIITATAAGNCTPKSTNYTVTITPTVGTPVFSSGTISSRCQAAGSVTYTATATNNTGITYSLDATSTSAGNSISSSTGTVTYVAGWSGTSVITVTASGCNGPSTASHTVTITPQVSTPVFALGSTSTRCQGLSSQTITYTATAANSTSITYALDATTSAFPGNSINTSTGAVTYAAGWTGTSTITATAINCPPNKTSTHVVTTTPTVGSPVFSLGTTSSRCEAGGIVNYGASATNNTGITYTLDNTSSTAGNTINSSTGDVTYIPAWYGTSVITATATGCNGPKSSSHTATTNQPVTTPVFTLGATSVRCQGSGSVTYTATASYNTGISYSLDATTAAFAGNSFNTTTGTVTYAVGWTGISTITVTATGCYGPNTSTHTVTTTPYVTTPVFAAGGSSTRCQGGNTVNYQATSSNTSGITYTLDATSLGAGNTINSTTGDVTYNTNWNGSTTITASAAGCNGPKTAVHVVTITASVGKPVFASASSTRTQSAGSINYGATATTTTGITYSLDATSLSAGNTINSLTGTVTYVSSWSGASVITASAAGCNGPVSSTHIAETNPITVTTPLYFSSNPTSSLNRISPIATNRTTTLSTSTFKSGSGIITFTQLPVLCSFLTIKNNSLKVIAYVTVSGGSIPVTPNISAKLRYDSITIINLTNPVYNSGTGIITWTGTPASDIIVPAGKAIAVDITSNEAALIKINYDSKTSPSRIELPVSNYVNITSFKIYDAPYPAGAERNSSVPGISNYIRTVASSPFGAEDVTGVNITITPNGNTFISNVVDSSSCSKTFEYNWNTPVVPGKYSITASALQGYENTVSYFDVISSNVCTVCPPVALNDSASGAGGAPILIDVLENDYDPNNNLKKASLTLITAPKNGDAIITGYRFVYVPNGTFAGRDTFRYQICDSTGLCAIANVYVSIDPTIVDPCSDATKSHVYYIPYPEQDARTALIASASNGLVINNLRDILSLKMPYPNMTIVWDHWEDGYEADILNPTQSTTQVWGDGNPYNGIAPGYPDDILPAGANIVLDNTMPANPRDASNIFYDGKDKIFASGQVSIVQVVGEPSVIGLQCMKTNVTSTQDFGTSFTVPVGQNFPSQDFAYTALFIRAAQNNTIVNIDKDNNGTYETTDTLNEGQSAVVSGVLTGANITSSAPIGVDLHFGGVDSYSSREIPIYPASWYSSTYYSPVPTTGSATAIKDTNAVYMYNNLNRALTINWSSGIPSSGSIVLPAKSVKRFPLAVSQTAAYKFVNPTGESFTAVQICDSYTPGGGGNSGSTFDWAFNLISEERLTAFATLAWAPGSTDGTRDDNPIWVTPSANTTIYVKYNGDLTTGGSVSPCGLHYDISYPLNALNHKRLKDLTDNDQGGLAVYTCDGTKIAAVYGEDPSTASTGNPSWDVGSTMRPFCGLKLIFANDDYAFTVTDNAVTIPILKNDYGFTAIVDPTSVITAGLLQPKNGSVIINSNGTVLYTPNPGYQGKDTFEYRVCSTPSPIVCDNATVYVTINSCPPPSSRNILYGKVFLDKGGNGVNSSSYPGFTSGKVYLYTDGNCNGVIDPNEISDSVTVDASGNYQFITYPEKIVSDNFDGTGTSSTCGSGSDGNSSWAGNWVDAGDPSTGFCVSPALSISNTHAEIIKDGSFGYGLRLKYKNVSASRAVNLNNATYAFLTFSYRRTSATQITGHDIYVQASTNGTSFNTIFTIKGDGTTDASNVTVYNQDITSYASSTTVIRFLTNGVMGYADSVYIDNVIIKYLKYPQCYIVKVPQSALPSNYYMTTASQSTITFGGSGSCATPNDFGVSSASILPISLLNFTGQAIKQANLLNWTTTQEINSSHFEIETKTDATDFTKIGRVEAKGNSVSQNSYSFVHQYPPLGVNYYRLKIFDKDNKFKYSNIIVLKADGTGVIQNSIYPNPFRDKIEAAIVLEQNQILNISIYDVNGKVVKSLQTQGTKGLNLIKVNDLGNITPGIYFLEIKSNEVDIKTKLFKIN